MVKDARAGSRYAVAALDRGLTILQTLAASDRPLALRDVAAHARVPKTTAFRLLATLETRGFVERTRHGGYRLGLRIVQLAQTVRDIDDLRDAALPLLQRLHAVSEETVNLAKWQDGEAVYLEVLPSRQPLRFVEAPGSVAPLHATALGKAIAAHLPEAEVVAILRRAGMPRFTPRTITSVPRYLDEIRRVRLRGFATDQGETDLGAACIAAPVFDARGVVGAISLSAPAPRLHERRAARLVPPLLDACAALSRHLGQPRATRVSRAAPVASGSGLRGSVPARRAR